MEWQSFPLDSAKEIKERLGGTLNDVILAVTAGAMHRFMRSHKATSRRSKGYRIVVPVNVRAGTERSFGNHVSAYLPDLPVDVADPLERYARVREELGRVKASRGAQGIALFHQLADRAGSTLATRAGIALATRLHPYNLIVTNVQGPRVPLYLLGARLLEIVPELPLFEHQGLGVAVMSYDGELCFGLVGDYDLVPELDRLRADFVSSFDDLVRTAADL